MMDEELRENLELIIHDKQERIELLEKLCDDLMYLVFNYGDLNKLREDYLNKIKKFKDGKDE